MEEAQKVYGLIGEKLSHSFSQKYFTDKFDIQFINAVYLNFELNRVSEIDELFKRGDICGLNVTIPYKEAVISFLDELSDEASVIGAVNTIQFCDGKTIGHNTDAFGFKQMIKPFLKAHHERAVILGTGGASKAVAYVLDSLGVDVIYISRNPNGQDQFAYDEINDVMMNSIMMVINTTPLGTYPNVNVIPAFPTNYLTPKHLVVDLIYNPEKTRLLKESEAKGAVILNGMTMLKQQAEKSWEIWNE